LVQFNKVVLLTPSNLYAWAGARLKAATSAGESHARRDVTALAGPANAYGQRAHESSAPPPRTCDCVGVTASDPPSTWRITDRSVEVAQSRGFLWLLFADRALERTRKSGLVMGGLVTESWSCVLALSHVRKCAELAVSTATVPEARLVAESGLDTFDAAVPRLKDARDFLEHLEDAYVLGAGKLQQSQIKQNKKVIDQHAAESWPYQPFYINQDVQRPAVRIGPDILIDLTYAFECGVRLHGALYQAAHHQGLQASGWPQAAN